MKQILLTAVLAVMAVPAWSASYVLSVENNTERPIMVNNVAVAAGLTNDGWQCFKFPLLVKSYEKGAVDQFFVVEDTGQKCTAAEGKEGAWKFTITPAHSGESKPTVYCEELGFAETGYAQLKVDAAATGVPVSLVGYAKDNLANVLNQATGFADGVACK